MTIKNPKPCKVTKMTAILGTASQLMRRSIIARNFRPFMPPERLELSHMFPHYRRTMNKAKVDLKQTSARDLARRIDAAMGRTPCDLVIRNVRYLDVFSCAWRQGDVAIAGGAIVGLEPGLKGRRELEGRGKFVVPGFIDAHVHIESSLLTPDHFEAAVLPRGTTSAICDPHELANVLGVSGLRYFLDASEQLALDLRVMLSSCVPATHFETNGGGVIRANDLAPLFHHSRALGLAEMMNVPGVLHADPEVLAKLVGAGGRPRRRPLPSGARAKSFGLCRRRNLELP